MSKVKQGTIKELKFDPQNANKGTERGNQALEESLQRYGAGRSVLADKNGVIIAGNKTVEKAGELGIENAVFVPTRGDQLVVVVREDLDLTTDPEARALAIADNRVGELDLNWNIEALVDSAKDLETLEPFFYQEEIDNLLASAANEAILEEQCGNTDPDETPDVQSEAISFPGSLWTLGSHRLLCGDSTNEDNIKRVIGTSKVDLVLTDPPYGIDVVGGGGQLKFGKVGGDKEVTIGKIEGNNIVKSKVYPVIKGDDSTDAAKIVYELCINMGMKNYVIFGGNYFTDFLPPSRCWFIWDKENTGNFADAELAWTSLKRGVKLFRWMWNGLARKGDRQSELASRVHPTQKPVGLFVEIIKEIDCKTIFDPFLGSGSTLIAAEKTTKSHYGIEFEPAYVDLIIRRWQEFTGQDAVLDGDGRTFNELEKSLK